MSHVLDASQHRRCVPELSVGRNKPVVAGNTMSARTKTAWAKSTSIKTEASHSHGRQIIMASIVSSTPASEEKLEVFRTGAATITHSCANNRGAGVWRTPPREGDFDTHPHKTQHAARYAHRRACVRIESLRLNCLILLARGKATFPPWSVQWR